MHPSTKNSESFQRSSNDGFPAANKPWAFGRVLKKRILDMNDRLIRVEEVISITSMPRSTIYKYMKLGRFPEKKGGLLGIAAWRLSDINEWVASNCWPPDVTDSARHV